MSKKFNIVSASIVATAATAAAQAGMLTMTASNASGADAWGSLAGYRLVLTIDCATLDAAGSSSAFTLNSWTFEAFDSTDVLVFDASGAGNGFSASGSGPFTALINLSAATIAVNDLSPMADYIAFSYQYSSGDSLGAAIEASALPSEIGELILGTSAGGGGDLIGFYSVPAPGTAALLALAGLATRRRRA